MLGKRNQCSQCFTRFYDMGKNIANCPECENIVEKSCEEEITNHEMEFLQEFSHEERDEELEISALTQELRSNKRIYKKILNEED